MKRAQARAARTNTWNVALLRRRWKMFGAIHKNRSLQYPPNIRSARSTMPRVSAVLLAAVAAAADFRVKFEVEVPSGAKEFTVLVHEDWSPIGAGRFRELVEAKFYDNTRCAVGCACPVHMPRQSSPGTSPRLCPGRWLTAGLPRLARGLQVLPCAAELHGAVRPQRRPRRLLQLARQDHHRRAGQGHQQARLRMPHRARTPD
jgi:hypothetical protein